MDKELKERIYCSNEVKYKPKIYWREGEVITHEDINNYNNCILELQEKYAKLEDNLPEIRDIVNNGMSFDKFKTKDNVSRCGFNRDGYFELEFVTNVPVLSEEELINVEYPVDTYFNANNYVELEFKDRTRPLDWDSLATNREILGFTLPTKASGYYLTLELGHIESSSQDFPNQNYLKEVQFINNRFRYKAGNEFRNRADKEHFYKPYLESVYPHSDNTLTLVLSDGDRLTISERGYRGLDPNHATYNYKGVSDEVYIGKDIDILDYEPNRKVLLIRERNSISLLYLDDKYNKNNLLTCHDNLINAKFFGENVFVLANKTDGIYYSKYLLTENALELVSEKKLSTTKLLSIPKLLAREPISYAVINNKSYRIDNATGEITFYQELEGGNLVAVNGENIAIKWKSRSIEHRIAGITSDYVSQSIDDRGNVFLLYTDKVLYYDLFNKSFSFTQIPENTSSMIGSKEDFFIIAFNRDEEVGKDENGLAIIENRNYLRIQGARNAERFTDIMVKNKPIKAFIQSGYIFYEDIDSNFYAIRRK